jgi:hypothetical protein
MSSKKSIIKRINRNNKKSSSDEQKTNTDSIQCNKIRNDKYKIVDNENELLVELDKLNKKPEKIKKHQDENENDNAADEDNVDPVADEDENIVDPVADEDNDDNAADQDENIVDPVADEDDPVEDENIGTLDPVEEKLFYFKSVGSNKIHCITQDQAKMSSIFGNMIDNDAYDEKSVISFKVITEIYDAEENSTAVYNLNNDEMFDIIVEYFNNWKKTPGTSNYIKLEHIQTSDPLQVLKKKDVEFIESYIKKIRENSSESIKIVFDKHQYDASYIYRKIVNTKILSGLLAQADYLDIQCLFNKISVYIACIIWSISIHDRFEMSSNKYFQQLSASTIKQAGVKLENHVASITAGDGKDDSLEDIQFKNNDQTDNKTLDTTTNIYNTENCKLLDDSRYEVFDEDSTDESD